MVQEIPARSLKELAERILSARSLLLTTHSGPDGDGIGSIAALGQALEESGCQVTRMLSDPFPRRYAFLDPRGQFRTFDPSTAGRSGNGPETWDMALILDTHQLEMIGPLGTWLRQREIPTAFLDHHPQTRPGRNDIYGDCSAVATGELVYRLLHHHLGLSLNPEVAEALYVAISFDTNSFKYVRSQPASLLIAADLITRGVDTNRVYRHLFASNSPGKARFLGRVLSSVQFDCEGRLAYVLTPYSVVRELQLERDDMRDSITHILEIQGVEVAATVKEMEPGVINISLRSKGSCSINGVAARMGGGGHTLAAGCDFKGSVEDAWAILRVPLLEAMQSPDPIHTAPIRLACEPEPS